MADQQTSPLPLMERAETGQLTADEVRRLKELLSAMEKAGKNIKPRRTGWRYQWDEFKDGLLYPFGGNPNR